MSTATRPDASMDLLTVIQRNALEPQYAQARAAGRGRRPAVGAVGLALAATLLTIAGLQTSRSAPVSQTERSHLVGQVRAEQQRTDELRASVARLDQQVSQLQAAQLPAGSASGTPDTVAQAARAGLAPVTGPGVVVTVDDAPGESGAHVADSDLRRLVNGLWQSGAEAIAVNGHRITARTAIRSAGSAITVDYRSLNRPYHVEAVGDPRALPGGFAASAGGQWWSFLHDNYGYTYQVATAGSLDLPGDPGLGVATATVPR